MVIENSGSPHRRIYHALQSVIDSSFQIPTFPLSVIKVTEEWFMSLGDERVVVDTENVQINSALNLAVVFATVKFTAKSAEGLTLRWLQNRLTCVIELKDHIWKINTNTPHLL